MLTYYRVLEWIEHDTGTNKDDFYHLEGIKGHRKKSNSQWEVHVEWASNQVLWEDMS